MNVKRVSIVGCGWLGFPLAQALLKKGYLVKGSTTSVEKLTRLNSAGIEAYRLELNPEPVGDVKSLLQTDTLIINVPPRTGKMGDVFHPQQISGLAQAIRESPVRAVIYVSSTSIYPEQNQIAVEETVTQPGESVAPALVEAEQLIQTLAPEQQIIILRCGGLLGYDRIPGKYVAGRSVDSGAVAVNYIHRDDAIGILAGLIERPLSGTFNAVAPNHPRREAVYRKSCADFGYVLPTFVEPPAPTPYKIISPQKLIDATDYRFLYPDPLQFHYERND